MGSSSVLYHFLIPCNTFVFHFNKNVSFYRLESLKHTNLWWHEGPLYSQNFVLIDTEQVIRNSKKSFLSKRSVSFLSLQRKVSADSAESKRRRSS
jgi:hypothetical protein